MRSSRVMKGNENRGAAGGHAALDLNAVAAENQARHVPGLLLKIQPFQRAVVFLHDARHGENVVLQLLAGGGRVQNKEGKQKHSFIPALQIPQEGHRVLAEGDEVGRQNVHVVACAHGFFLFLHLHFVDVADFPLDRLDGLGLVNRLDMQGNGHFGVHFQKLRKELVGKLGGQNLHIRSRAPCRAADTESAALPEVEGRGGNEILCPHAGFRNVAP